MQVTSLYENYAHTWTSHAFYMCYYGTIFETELKFANSAYWIMLKFFLKALMCSGTNILFDTTSNPLANDNGKQVLACSLGTF